VAAYWVPSMVVWWWLREMVAYRRLGGTEIQRSWTPPLSVNQRGATVLRIPSDSPPNQAGGDGRRQRRRPSPAAPL